MLNLVQVFLVTRRLPRDDSLTDKFFFFLESWRNDLGGNALNDV